MKVICINDRDRPNEIPISKWIVKDKIYSVIKIWHIRQKPGTYGLELAEIDLSNCFPYLYFSANRFAPVMSNKDIEAILEKALEEKEIIQETT
jgi:hypothetical protein